MLRLDGRGLGHYLPSAYISLNAPDRGAGQDRTGLTDHSVAVRIHERLKTACYRIVEIKLVGIALGRSAAGRLDDVLFRWLGNPVHHLRIHKRRIELPDFLVVRLQVQLGNALAKGRKEKLQHVAGHVILIRIAQKLLEAIVAVCRVQRCQIVFKWILDVTALEEDLVRPPDTIGRHEAGMQIQHLLVLREHDVRTDVIGDAVQRIAAAKAANRRFAFQHGHRPVKKRR